MGRSIPVFQKVTKDEYRLVLAQADSMTELAKMLGVSLSVISHAIKNVEKGKTRNSGYQVTWIEDD